VSPKRRRRHPFFELRPEELDSALAPDSRLFLGRFDAAALAAELGRAGLLAALAARGYANPALRADRVGDEHRLRIFPRGGRAALVELRLAEISLLPAEPLLHSRGLDVLCFLEVGWVALQDPRARFTRARPRLPGQRFPGLGVGRILVDLLRSWACAWGKDGLLNHPEHFHNAVFYASLFRFLSPREQGRFEALRRDLARLTVAKASEAIEAGRVAEASGRAFRWRPGAMVAPVSEELRAHLASPAYREEVAAARQAARFRLRRPSAPARRAR
jgi:hypothetical protein